MLTLGIQEVRDVLGETFSAWREDGAIHWGAALAYYAILSLPPLVLILLLAVGRVYGDITARKELLRWTGRIFGNQGVGAVRTILENAPASTGVVGVGSGLLLIALGTGVFAQLQKAMNHIWGVAWEGGGLASILRTRLLGFLVVLVLGLLFVLVVAVSAAVTFLTPYAERIFRGTATVVLGVNFALTFTVLTLLFATFFRILPDVRISWRDVWVGATVSAVLFLVGNTLLGIFFRMAEIGSAYGAAGSLLGVLMWVYYSAQVYFFGAEFTQVWARRYGGRIEPARGAMRRSR